MKVVHQETTSDGLLYVTVSLQREIPDTQIRLVRFSDQYCDLVVLDNGPTRSKPHYHDLADAMEHSHCLAGSNGGFFGLATFAPNGLMIASSERAGTFDPANWTGGVLAVRGRVPALETLNAFKLDASVTQLLQTGPWLVQNSRSQTNFTGDSESLPRTFIATNGGGTWILGQASALTLRDLASTLSSPVIRDIVPIHDALNLDGGPSSGWWLRGSASRPVYFRENTMVRNFLGIRKTVSGSRPEK